MGADGFKWVQMGADGCTEVQYWQNGVRRAQGGVGIHDLWTGWPGNFPPHHVRAYFGEKSREQETKPQNMKRDPT